MDYYSQLVTDPDLRTELLDRFDELAGAGAAKGGLEGLERLEPPTVDEADLRNHRLQTRRPAPPGS